MSNAFREAKTYSMLFLIAAIGLVIGTGHLDWLIKIPAIVTYWIFINKLQIQGGLVKRLIWNGLFLFTAAGILYLLDLSVPALVLKIISKAPLMGDLVGVLGILLKLPEAAIWALASLTFGWLAGIIQLEELPAAEQGIIRWFDELKYR